jgi:hypothetical protein
MCANTERVGIQLAKATFAVRRTTAPPRQQGDCSRRRPYTSEAARLSLSEPRSNTPTPSQLMTAARNWPGSALINWTNSLPRAAT